MRVTVFVSIPFLLFSCAVMAQNTDAPAAAPTPAPDKSGYTLFNPVPNDLLRTLNTDRPTKSNSPVTVDAGHFQIESDLFNYTHSNAGGVTTRLYTTLDPVLKLGVTDHIDLEVQFGGYNWLQTAVPGAGTFRQSGAGDLTLRAKVNLFGNESGPALALIPYVKVPTAAQGIGNGHTEGGVIAPFTYPLPYDFTLLIEPEVDVLKNYADAGHHFNYTQLINISHPVGPKVTVYGELYSALGTDARTPPVYTLDAAVAWTVSDTLQLDAGANIGLNRAAPNLQLYTGISKRF
jgi:hypothetical protein